MSIAKPAVIVVVVGLSALVGRSQSTASDSATAAKPSLKETSQWLESHLVGINAKFERTIIHVADPGKKKPQVSRETASIYS